MNKTEQVERLRRVGMTCFVKYFSDFSDESRSRYDPIEMLLREKNYTEKRKNRAPVVSQPPGAS